jgi:hypothetical protein
MPSSAEAAPAVRARAARNHGVGRLDTADTSVRDGCRRLCPERQKVVVKAA